MDFAMSFAAQNAGIPREDVQELQAMLGIICETLSENRYASFDVFPIQEAFKDGKSLKYKIPEDGERIRLHVRVRRAFSYVVVYSRDHDEILRILKANGLKFVKHKSKKKPLT